MGLGQGRGLAMLGPLAPQPDAAAAATAAPRRPPTAGTMFNIIRGVPLVGYNQQTRESQIFMSGQGAPMPHSPMMS